MTDREMLEWAAKAAGYDTSHPVNAERLLLDRPVASLWIMDENSLVKTAWNPLLDDGDRYRLAKKLGISIDFEHRCTWKRLASGEVIQVWWGGKFDDEARAVVNVAAEIGRVMWML